MPPRGDDDALLRKRDWLDRQIGRAMLRRRYSRLPEGHPMFDAEDLPVWWQRWAVEAVGAVIHCVGIVAAYAFSGWFGHVVNAAFDHLTGRVP